MAACCHGRTDQQPPTGVQDDARIVDYISAPWFGGADRSARIPSGAQTDRRADRSARGVDGRGVERRAEWTVVEWSGARSWQVRRGGRSAPTSAGLRHGSAHGGWRERRLVMRGEVSFDGTGERRGKSLAVRLRVANAGAVRLYLDAVDRAAIA